MYKCVVGKVPFSSFFFLRYDHLFKQQLENGLSTHHHFTTKLMLITSQSSTTIQRLHNYIFTPVDKAVHSHKGAVLA